MSRKPRLFIALAQLSLLTLALVSCGGQQAVVPTAPQSETASAQIVTVSVRPGTTQADLLSRYPGAEVLALYPDEGYAQILSTQQALLAAPAMTGLSLRAQAVVVVATEPNQTLSTSETLATVGAQGNNAWSGGNTAWSGGNTAWSGGLSGTDGNAALASNAALWSKLDLSTGQKASPLLGQGIKVAVLDTGVDINHPAFAGRLDTKLGWDYVGNDADPSEENWASAGQFSKSFGHGTAVTSVILQVAPNVTILPYRVLNPDGSGLLSNVILALHNASMKGAKVINLSLGATTPSAALDVALSGVMGRGAVIVASSGNSGDENVSYPARSSNDVRPLEGGSSGIRRGGGLISVGSVSLNDTKSGFSTYGPSIDVVAPGEAVGTAFPGGLRTNATGTSFAAPMVSGAVALAIGGGEFNVKVLIKATATPSTDTNYPGMFGAGILNIGKMMVNR